MVSYIFDFINRKSLDYKTKQQEKYNCQKLYIALKISQRKIDSLPSNDTLSFGSMRKNQTYLF